MGPAASKLSPVIFVGAVLLTAVPDAAGSGTVTVPGANFWNLEVKVRTMKESQFRTTLQQQYDFSCGSAALATLLSHHYDYQVTEAQIYDEMYERGNRDKIRREGFSLLDMKNYLSRHGFESDGFRISLDQLRKVGVPAIVLIDKKGYNHFVVVQGITDSEVLLGDPALGGRAIARTEFFKMWNGLVFLIRNKKDVAQLHFNRKEDWDVQVRAPLAMGLAGTQAINDLLFLPLKNGP